jgi:hypothetical protein
MNVGGGNTHVYRDLLFKTDKRGIRRDKSNRGYLIGSFNQDGNKTNITGPIYTIGTSYDPNETTLDNMYGIGYTKNSGASFITDSGTDSWGMYIAAAGVARIWMGSNSGGDSYWNTSGKFGFGGVPTSTNEYGNGREGVIQIFNGSRPAIEIKNGETYPSGGVMTIYSDSEDTSYPLSNSSNGQFGQVNHGSVWWIGINSIVGSTSRNYLTFWDGEAGGYFGYGNVGYISFTGQHFSKPSAGIASDYTNKIGQIVIAEGTYDNFEGDEIAPNRYGPNVDESLPKVTISTQANDKRVFGVISKCEVGDVREGGYSNLVSTSTIKPNDHRLIINSIGEGAIWVSNINGNLENGDYITTSAIEGLGMKQDDDLLHNYTVAKITQDEDFASGTTNVTYDGTTYKTKLVGCTYHCG